MTLKIKTVKGYYDLPEDYSIEIENTSPIYNQRGSMTIASSIPPTKHNLALINHAHREDVASKPVKDLVVSISDGVYHRRGKQNISTPSVKDGIQSTIGFDESLMYEAWNNVSLKKLPGLPKYQPEGGVPEIMEHLTKVMKYEENADYYIFPIVVSQEESNGTKYPVFINPIEVIEESTPPVYDLKKAARSERTIVSGELMNITVPAGYGISPFIKVSRVLELIVSAYGYKLIDTPFHTHHQLKKMVLLNNTADTIVEGFIDYADLMPDCTVNEFLDSIYCRTGARVYVNGDEKTVRVILLKDSITSSPSSDWTYKKASPVVPTYTAAKQLKLSASTSFEGASPATDNYEDFYKKYSGVITTFAGNSIESVESFYFLFYNSCTGNYYKNNIVTNTQERISSDFFPWDKKDSDLEYEEVVGNDECVPMAFTQDLLTPQYLAGARHSHTSLRIAAVAEEESEDDTPLAFCFALGMAQSKSEAGTIVRKGYYYGSTFCRYEHGDYFKDPAGNTYRYSLVFHGPDGAFAHFFKEWDAILRHADNSYDGEFHLDKTVLSGMDVSRPVRISGQRMMIDKAKFSLPVIKSQPTVVTLRSLKLLLPYNLEEEQELLVPQAQSTKWTMFSTANELYEKRMNELISEYAHDKYYSVGLFSLEIITKPSSDEYDSYLPPSVSDVNSQKRIFNTYSAKMRYNLIYYPSGSTYPGTVTVKEEAISYQAGIRAEMI